MDFPCALYDALLAINVPREKAHAVVDAWKRDRLPRSGMNADPQLTPALSLSDLGHECLMLRKDMELLTFTLLTRVGYMLAGAAGVLFVALRLN